MAILSEGQFTETLNFRVSPNVKSLLVSQAERLDMTQTALARLCLLLGLEAVARLSAGGEVVEARR